MPSSISNSDHDVVIELREVPELSWFKAMIVALVVTVIGIAWWEWRARDYGLLPGTYEGLGLWAEERRKIDRDGADALAIIGSSRMLYDTNLDVWEDVTGIRPIQLANEGTSPQRFLEDLADDPDFTGLVIVGVASGLYMDQSPGYMGQRLDRYQDETPSQWLGQKIHNRLAEHFAFLDAFNALFSQINHHFFPGSREGVKDTRNIDMRLGDLWADRQTTIWAPVEEEGFYLDLVLQFWRGGFDRPLPPPEEQKKSAEEVFAFTEGQIAKLKAKGADVVFVYPPFSGGYMEQEIKHERRNKIWQPMVDRFDAVTIHFQDYPELSEGMVLPEWSHLDVPSAKKFSAALAKIIMEELEERESPAVRLFQKGGKGGANSDTD